MATDTSILREFLVSLGFKVENADRFKQSIENATKSVASLGTALEGLGAVALGAFNKVATKYRDLEYASQRLNGMPVRSIMAYQQAMKMSGASTEEAMSSIEGFGRFMRTNPNALTVLQGFGVNTRDANGKVRSISDMMYQFGNVGKQLASQGRLYEYYGKAKMVGISEESADALMRDPASQARSYLKDLDKQGLTEEKIKAMSDAMARWAQRWTMFTGELALFTDNWISKLSPIFNAFLNWIQKMDQKTGGLSTQFIALMAALMPIITFGNPIIAVIGAIAAGIALLFEDFNNWQTKGKSVLPWGEWSPTLKEIWKDIKDIGQALGDVFGGASMGNLGKVLSGFVKDELGALKDMLDAILHGLNAIKQFKSGNVKGGLGELGQAGQSAAKSLFVDQYKTLKDEMHNWTAGKSDQPVQNMEGAVKPYINKLMRGGQQVAGQAAEFLAKHGVPVDKIQGILGGIYAESGLKPNAKNPTSGAFGIGQWLGARKKELFRRYGPNPNLNQQLEYLWYELNGGDSGGKSVLNAKGVEGTLSAYVNNFMRPGPGAAGDMSRGRAWLAQNGGGDFNQTNITTNIHVHGSGDPNQTAQAVAQQQQRVYGNATRYNKPAAS